MFVRLGANAKLQVLAALVVTIVGLMLRLSAIEWMAVVGCVTAVLALEAINTSIELLADEVSLERRPTIRTIKDIAAGAVLIAAIGSVIVAGIILFRHLAR